jgi:hypothetical protein
MAKSRAGPARSASGRATALDAVLAHISYESATLANPIVQMGINLSSIASKKQSKDYQSQILLSLEQYPAKDSSFFLIIPTVVAMARSNPAATLSKLFDFFPSAFVNDPPSSCVEQDILSFLPKLIPGSSSPLNYVVAYFSEAIFATLVEYMIERWQSVEADQVERILSRLFQRSSLSPPEDSLQSRILRLSVDRFRDIVAFISKADFGTLSKCLTAEFPLKKEGATVYFPVLSHVRFTDPPDVIFQFPKIFDAYAKNQEVVAEALECLCFVIPQLPARDSDFVKKIAKRIEPWLKTPGLWKRKTIALYGAIHGLKRPRHRNDKFFEKSVVPRLQKQNKVEFALRYMNNFIHPIPEKCNWKSEFAPTIANFCRHFIVAPVELDRAGSIQFLINMALFDLHTFVAEVAPQLLKMAPKFVPIVYEAFAWIANPMTGFQELLGRAPQQPHFQKELGAILKIVGAALQGETGRVELYDLALNYMPLSDLFDRLVVPLKYEVRNTTDLPTKVLYMAMLLKDMSNISPIAGKQRELLKDSERCCEGSLSQWMAGFDIPHHSFGELDEKLTLKTAGKIARSDRSELTLLQITPILLSQIRDFVEYTPYLLDMVVSDDIHLAVAAAWVYESLFYTFPLSSVLFLNEVVLFLKNRFAIVAGVDSEEVSAFVARVESAEQSGNWE